MSEAKVGYMINWMCKFYFDCNALGQLLLELLNDRVITHHTSFQIEVYGGEAHIALLRRIREAVLQQPWHAETIGALDADVNGVYGPLYFNLIKIMYVNFSCRFRCNFLNYCPNLPQRDHSEFL